MARWQRGEAEIESLLAAGSLQRVRGDKSDGAPWISKAMKTAVSAEELVTSNPESAVTLAYEAIRFACCGALAQ